MSEVELAEPRVPASGKQCDVVEAVRADLLRRSQLGIAKYGHTLAENPLKLREWLQHAYEECLDQANYLKRSIMEIDARTVPVRDADVVRKRGR